VARNSDHETVITPSIHTKGQIFESVSVTGKREDALVTTGADTGERSKHQAVKAYRGSGGKEAAPDEDQRSASGFICLLSPQCFNVDSSSGRILSLVDYGSLLRSVLTETCLIEGCT
jgi:hypothetical protein